MGKVIQLPRRRKLKIDLKENSVIVGDCLEWLKNVPSNSIDMCYIDPPFFSNKNYEIIWRNGYERRAYEDRWKGGVKSYIVWMEDRVKEIHRVLKSTGTILLHCDHHASHRLRVMLDDVFGEKNFVNEIVWCYRGGGVPKKMFARKHDNIFIYSKSKNWTFNVDSVRNPYSEETKDRCKYVAQSFRQNKTYNKWRPNPKGKHPEDWLEIQPIMPSSKERIGYKTQKPEALLKKMIKAFSNNGDIILDCFGGGGTTASVATRLGRKFITGDVSPVAVRVMSKRLKNLDAPPHFPC